MKKYKFFSFEREHVNPERNGRKKIILGFVFFLLSIIILIQDNNALSNFFSIRQSIGGEIVKLIVSLIYQSIGKWISFLIFTIIGLLFIYSGVKEIKNN